MINEGGRKARPPLFFVMVLKEPVFSVTYPIGIKRLLAYRRAAYAATGYKEAVQWFQEPLSAKSIKSLGASSN